MQMICKKKKKIYLCAQEFVEAPTWMHLDIAGVMDGSDMPYLSKGKFKL